VLTFETNNSIKKKISSDKITKQNAVKKIQNKINRSKKNDGQIQHKK
jgi:hypothetical protein